MKIPELLSPAGEIDSAKHALAFGADAVYLAGKSYGMRSSSRNFDHDQLVEITNLAHQLGKKVYVTMNSLPTNDEIVGITEYIKELDEVGVDSVIVADIGLLNLVHKTAPDLKIHASTQAGVTNYLTANSLYDLGASRIVLARELSLQDIKELKEQANPNIEFEIFVHGSMCMAFSGRCFLSEYLNARSANRGDCSQPCRWIFNTAPGEESSIVGEVFEKTRPNMPIPLEENEFGTSILSAQDLSMVDHLDDIVALGIDSIKIEGRAKSAYYSAIVTNAYRVCLDAVENENSLINRMVPTPTHPPAKLSINFSAPDIKFQKLVWAFSNEVNTVSHRVYSTGFFYSGKLGEKRKPPTQDFSIDYQRNRKFIGDVLQIESGILQVKIRNKLIVGESYELITPGNLPVPITVKSITDHHNHSLEMANRTLDIVAVETDTALEDLVSETGVVGLLREKL
jgi:putative protease